MCGICGWVDTRRDGRAAPAQVRQMTAAIRHRGPDGDGFYDAPNVSLGMRRLSIIDVAGSDQPLYNEDASIALVFNGEIYNYRELRDQLSAQGHHLRTEGDGETIIHLYEQYGLDLFSHLRGMYGFALWDARRERLLLAVDHIGMKPLYLHEQSGMLAFASEIKALLAAEVVSPELTLEVLDTYLSFGFMVGPQTPFAHVRRLMPGHALLVENGQVREWEYWRFGSNFAPQQPAPPMLTADAPAIIAQARQLITEAVHLHLRSDVPLGLFLSGGIDSAATLALMAREASGRIQTYTVGYAGSVPDNELEHARRIAAHFNTDHHERVISAEDWWNALAAYAYHHDEPNANPSAVSLMLLAEETARHVKVVLTGLGGDELFGGYMHHRVVPWLLRMQPRLRGLEWFASPLGALEAAYPAMKRYRGIGALPTYLPRVRQALLPRDEGLRRMLSYDGLVMSDALRHQLYGADLRSAVSQSRHTERTYEAVIARSLRSTPEDTAQALVINTWLHGNALLSQDKVTMAHSLEARVPFFDPALLAFAAQIPPAVRMAANKVVLREALRPDLPTFALERPKQPFSTPIRSWFEGPLRDRSAGILLDQGAFVRSLFDAKALERLVQRHQRGVEKHEEVMFRLLLLELWARRFLRPEHSADASAHYSVSPSSK